MYLQITTRCNMFCKHCCFSCTAVGNDMSFSVYKAAIKLAGGFDCSLVIGGGEPTIHPEFWEYLGLALSVPVESLWMATNGSVTETALRLSELARKGVLGVALSMDPWHGKIDQRVVKAFNGKRVFGYSGEDQNDCREVRDVSRSVISSGRAVEYGVGTRDACPCEGLFVDPYGAIWACGCKQVSFGTAFNPDIPGEWDGCSRDPDNSCRSNYLF